jgi:uncharacterized protein
MQYIFFVVFVFLCDLRGEYRCGSILPMPNPFSNLQKSNYMALTTYRKTGLAVTSPVWFAQAGDALYVVTEPHSGKMKRIRNNGQVQVAPCNVRGVPKGPAADATAREVTSPADCKAADDALNAKYGVQKKMFELLWKVQKVSPTYVEVRGR